MNTDYNKIINMPHHVSSKHKQMPVADRAAQFSSFAALKGYEQAVEEVARVTESKVELTEDACAELDFKLSIVAGLLPQKSQIAVTYFVPDKNKAGGRYLRKTGVPVKVDSVRRVIVFADGTSVLINSITDITIL